MKLLRLSAKNRSLMLAGLVGLLTTAAVAEDRQTVVIKDALSAVQNTLTSHFDEPFNIMDERELGISEKAPVIALLAASSAYNASSNTYVFEGKEYEVEALIEIYMGHSDFEILPSYSDDSLNKLFIFEMNEGREVLSSLVAVNDGTGTPALRRVGPLYVPYDPHEGKKTCQQRSDDGSLTKPNIMDGSVGVNPAEGCQINCVPGQAPQRRGVVWVDIFDVSYTTLIQQRKYKCWNPSPNYVGDYAALRNVFGSSFRSYLCKKNSCP